MKPLLILLSLSALTLTACQSQQVAQCQESDWFEIGRRDGAQGDAPKHEPLDLVPAICEGSVVADESDNYTNGYNSGLVEYCQAKSAFALGRTQQIVKPEVCPVQMKSDFTAAYDRGLSVAKLEQDIVELERQKQSLTSEIQASRRPQGLKKKLAQIVSQQESNERKIQNLSQQL